MSPTILIDGPYRYFFFSREEQRMHVHIECSDGEAKFWLEPIISLANSEGLDARQLGRLQKKVAENSNEIKRSWKKHFKG